MSELMLYDSFLRQKVTRSSQRVGTRLARAMVEYLAELEEEASRKIGVTKSVAFLQPIVKFVYRKTKGKMQLARTSLCDTPTYYNIYNDILVHRYQRHDAAQPSWAQNSCGLRIIGSRRSQKIEAVETKAGLRTSRLQYFGGHGADFILVSTREPFFTSYWSTRITDKETDSVLKPEENADHTNLKKNGFVEVG